MDFDLEQAKKIIDELMEKRPTKDVFEKCLADITTEKNKIFLHEDNKKLLDELDKVIETIILYLRVTSK